ncbi:MAG: BtpA/SgcQ family protein [Firmicutes bacterium]|nr:BtpA/SgcQ family protein [Bacillota bacterium]
MTWLKDLFGTEKPIIAMAHFPPLPGSPLYDENGGVRRLVDSVGADVERLQKAGVDAIMFCNEGDRPYSVSAGPETVATMAFVIGNLQSALKVPFGVDVLWDPRSAISLGTGTGARFVREVFTGVYSSDMGLWSTDCAAVLRHRRLIGGSQLRLFYNIVPEFASDLDTRRSIEMVARSVVFSSLADALLVSGPMASAEADLEILKRVKSAVPGVPVLCNTGVRLDNVEKVLAVGDGAVVGSHFKEEGVIWNPVSESRVVTFMELVRHIREKPCTR